MERWMMIERMYGEWKMNEEWRMDVGREADDWRLDDRRDVWRMDED